MQAWSAVLAMVVSLLPVAASAQAPPYRLLPEEIARYRALDGEISAQALGARGEPLMRAIRAVAGGRRGQFRGPSNVAWSVYQAFNEFMSGPNRRIVVEQGLLLGSGCHGPECGQGSAFLIDLKTGDVAIALAHESNFGGTGNGGNVTVFVMACAGDAFRRAARERFRVWGGTVLWPNLEKERVHMATTPCAGSPPPTVVERPPFAPGSPRLTKAEVAAVRKVSGKTRRLFDGDATRMAMLRVFSQLGGEESTRIGGEASPMYVALLTAFRHSEMAIRQIGGGVRLGFGCHDGESACGNRSKLFIDPRTGDVAVMLSHRLDWTGNRLEMDGFTVFVSRCAGQAIRDLALTTAREDGELRALGKGWPRTEGAKPRIIESDCT